MSKKAQAWGFDVIIATGIFLFGMTAFFLYTINYPGEEQQKLEDLLYEGDLLASSLLSPGSPENWTAQLVSKIGLLSNNVLDQNKLEEFYNLPYPLTKSLFGIKYDYFINSSQPLEISGAGIAGIGIIPENSKNNIKISRVTIYKNKPITLEIQLWE